MRAAKKNNERTITITPDMFVSKPYIKCPKCGEQAYGVLMINRRSYVRRCNKCMHSESYKLPDVEKKVIYLDQMAISNMMNSIRPSTNPNRRARIPQQWRTMFEKLDRLVKLQLIICPSSLVHQDESIVTPVFKDLKQMYEHLGHGLEFYDIATIVRFQYYEAFMKWLGVSVDPITVHSITHGNINEWQERFRISIESGKDPADYVTELEKMRQLSSAGLTEVFNRWKTETSKSFTDWYNEERNAYGPAYWREYIKSVLDESPSNMLNFVMSDRSVLMTQLINILGKHGTTDEQEKFVKLLEFFCSDQAKEILYLTIYSMLAAALANQSAHGGRIQPPNEGTSNDMNYISAFTPYCDALFIDNAFKENIGQGDKVIKLGIADKFFSANDFEAFFKYLDKIEANAPKGHIEKVLEVYGEDWAEPYTTMYKPSI